MTKRSSSAIGPGEGFDLGETEFSRKVLPRKLGVLFEFVVDVMGERSMKIVGRFPEEQHSDRVDTDSIYTQAEIAETFIKGTMKNSAAGSGQWRQWAVGDIENIIDNLQEKVKRRLEIRTDERVGQAKKEWSRILRGKKAQDQIKPLREAIKKARAEKKKYFKMSHEKMPTFEQESGSVAIVELIRKTRISFLARRKRSLATARTKRREIKELSDKLFALKKEIIEESRSRQWADAIEESMSAMRLYEELGDRAAKSREQERYVALSTPFAIKANISGILNGVASDLKRDMEEIFEGMKAPELSPKTLRNRRWRGHDSNVPLYETGEFAESFIVEVVAA